MDEAITQEEWDARVKDVERAFDEHFDKLRANISAKASDACRIAVLQTLEADMDLVKRQTLAALRGEPGVKGS